MRCDLGVADPDAAGGEACLHRTLGTTTGGSAAAMRYTLGTSGAATTAERVSSRFTRERQSRDPSAASCEAHTCIERFPVACRTCHACHRMHGKLAHGQMVRGLSDKRHGACGKVRRDLSRPVDQDAHDFSATPQCVSKTGNCVGAVVAIHCSPPRLFAPKTREPVSHEELRQGDRVLECPVKGVLVVAGTRVAREDGAARSVRLTRRLA